MSASVKPRTAYLDVVYGIPTPESGKKAATLDVLTIQASDCDFNTGRNALVIYMTPLRLMLRHLAGWEYKEFFLRDRGRTPNKCRWKHSPIKVLRVHNIKLAH
jgi:hypothetical protein